MFLLFLQALCLTSVAVGSSNHDGTHISQATKRNQIAVIHTMGDKSCGGCY